MNNFHYFTCGGVCLFYSLRGIPLPVAVKQNVYVFFTNCAPFGLHTAITKWYRRGNDPRDVYEDGTTGDA
jgi:hypothetical protein